MKTTIFTAILTVCFVDLCLSQSTITRFNVTKDIEVTRISEHCYVHVSYVEVPGGKRSSSNGLVYTSDGEALLFDTPMTDSLTKTLVQWLTDSLKVRVVGFVPNHWHEDCMGGLRYLQSLGIPSYAHEKTIAIAKSKNLPVPQYSFADSLILHVGKEIVVCRYFGAAHTADNIVCWIPSEGVLFGGCMVKELKSEILGNTANADLSAWPLTIGRVLAAYPAVRKVVPGHGAIGGKELLIHTQALLTKTK